MSLKPKRSGEMTGATGPEGWAIYNPSTGDVHFLNDSARAIWELCDGETSVSEMAEAISELTGIPKEEAARDVSETIERLLDLGLVAP